KGIEASVAWAGQVRNRPGNSGERALPVTEGSADHHRPPLEPALATRIRGAERTGVDIPAVAELQHDAREGRLTLRLNHEMSRWTPGRSLHRLNHGLLENLLRNR